MFRTGIRSFLDKLDFVTELYLVLVLKPDFSGWGQLTAVSV